jgi:hypothetical protein
MPLPIIAWVALAAGGALGITGTVAVSEAGDNIADASDSLNKTLKTAAVIGAGIYVATQTDLLKKVF